MKKRKSKVIGIVGTRRKNSEADFRRVYDAVKKVMKDGDRFVSGGCPKGGDNFAECIARLEGRTITIHHADWWNSKAAGFIRNTSIAEDCDVLIAMVAADRTGGTEDTIKKAARLGKKIILVK